MLAAVASVHTTHQHDSRASVDGGSSCITGRRGWGSAPTALRTSMSSSSSVGAIERSRRCHTQLERSQRGHRNGQPLPLISSGQPKSKPLQWRRCIEGETHSSVSSFAAVLDVSLAQARLPRDKLHERRASSFIFTIHVQLETSSPEKRSPMKLSGTRVPRTAMPRLARQCHEIIHAGSPRVAPAQLDASTRETIVRRPANVCLRSLLTPVILIGQAQAQTLQLGGPGRLNQ